MTTIEEKLEHIKNLNRIRQSRYYEKNKEKIAEQRRAKRIAKNESKTEPEKIPVKRVFLKLKIKRKQEPLTLERAQEIASKLNFNDSTQSLSQASRVKYGKNIKQFFKLWDTDSEDKDLSTIVDNIDSNGNHKNYNVSKGYTESQTIIVAEIARYT
jgi:UTP:GlnB (protein PII) uridylyltransferase